MEDFFDVTKIKDRTANQCGANVLSLICGTPWCKICGNLFKADGSIVHLSTCPEKNRKNIMNTGS